MVEISKYDYVNNLLESFLKITSGIFKNNLCGIYLYGSLTYEAFVPYKSDIDLVVVIMEEQNMDSIKTMHESFNETFPATKGRVECLYVTLSNLVSNSDHFEWRFNKLIKRKSFGKKWVITQHFLENRSITLYGPDFKNLVEPTTLDKVLIEIKNHLYSEFEIVKNNPKWLQNSDEQSHLVLDMSRVLYALLNRDLVSKIKAANWVKINFPQWKTLIEEILNWRYGKPLDKYGDCQKFIQFVVHEFEKTI